VLAVVALAACAKHADQPARSASATAAETASSPAAATSTCPATGLWTACAVFQRLDRAGLAPRLDSSVATEPPLAARGTVVKINNADLEIYLYADAEARQQDEAKLERSRYLDYAAPVSMQTLPTLIHSANLIAVLHSRNDHQRERVADALTAGPPQP
jgi:hypothetical protein